MRKKGSDNTKHDTHLFGLLRIFFFSASLIKKEGIVSVHKNII